MKREENLGCCILFIIMIAIALYCGMRIAYGLGREAGYRQGQEDKVSRAVCMKYMVFEDAKWRGK